MGMVRVISKRGDDRVQWNEQDAQAGDAEALAAIREAERIAGPGARQGRRGFPCRNRQACPADRAVRSAGRADYFGATGSWWMNMELLVTVGLAILVVLSFVLILGLFLKSYLKWSEAARRADELLRSVLSQTQYDQLTRNGYLDIPSPRDPACIYRVPRAQGLVKVLEQGRLKKSLCLQPQEMVPDDDLVVMHKLMIEADEETYLQTANTFTPITSSSWND